MRRVEFMRPYPVWPGVHVEYVQSGEPVKVLVGQARPAVTAWREAGEIVLSTGARFHLAGPMVRSWVEGEGE